VNQYLDGRLGLWIVTVRVKGMESGNMYEETLQWERVFG
jgi:hypothetical protein